MYVRFYFLLLYILHWYLHNKTQNLHPANTFFCGPPISTPSFTLYHPLPLNSSLTHLLAVPRMQSLFLPHSLWLFSFFSSSNLSPVHLHDPLPRFIHISALKALPQESHPSPLPTTGIISCTTYYDTTASSHADWLLFTVDIMCHIHPFPPACKLHEDRGFVIISASLVA